jgi:hypothetical protein
MTKKDEIINKLILETGKEVDYWLLESNQVLRESEVGIVPYKKISARMEALRHHLLEAVFLLPEAHVKLTKKTP